MTTLTNQEKIDIVNQHLKNVNYSLYNLSLSVVEENAVSEPNSDSLANLNAQISDLNAKKTTLEAELQSLSE
jgi:ABC-type phosphate transport system auxiliary subunit